MLRAPGLAILPALYTKEYGLALTAVSFALLLLRLFAWHSGKCLDIAGGRIANGAGVQQYDCHGGPNQLFRLERTNDGSFLLRAGHSGKCIDVRGWRREDGVPIQQYDCHGGDNQGWWLQYGRPRR